MKDSDDPTDPIDPEQLRAEVFQAVCERVNDPGVQSRLESALMELRLSQGVTMQAAHSARSQDPLLDLLLGVLGLKQDGEAVAEGLAQPLSEEQQRAAWVASQPITRRAKPATKENLPDYVLGEVVREKEATIIGWQPTEEALQELVEEREGLASEGEVLQTPAEAAPEGLVGFDGAEAMQRALDQTRQGVGEVYAEGVSSERRDETGEDTASPAEDEGGAPEAPKGDSMDFHQMLAASVADAEEWEEEEEEGSEPPPVAAPEPAKRPRRTAKAKRGPKKGARRAQVFAQADQALVGGAPQTAAVPSKGTGPRSMPPRPSEGTARSRGAQWVLFAAVALVVVAGMGLLGMTLGASQVDKARSKAEQKRDAMYANLERNDRLAEDIKALGGRAVSIEGARDAYRGSREPERARRALYLVNLYSEGMQDVRSAGSKYRQVYSEVTALERAKGDYEAALRFWAKQTGSPLGSLAIRAGWADVPEKTVLLPLP